MKRTVSLVIIAVVLLWCFMLYSALSYGAETVNTIVYIKTATFALKKVVVDPVTGKKTYPVISRHATAELAQKAAWKLAPGSYQIDPPTYYLEVKLCPDFNRVGYCTDWVDSRISVVQVRTTSRIMFVTPLPPGTVFP